MNESAVGAPLKPSQGGRIVQHRRAVERDAARPVRRGRERDDAGRRRGGDQRQIVSAGDGNGDDIGEVRGHVRLRVDAWRIAHPRRHCAVGFQRGAMLVAYRNVNGIGQTGWHICLAGGVAAPNHDAAIAFQHDAVVGSSSDGSHRVQIGWQGRGIAPSHRDAVVFQSHAAVAACGDGDHVAQPSWNVRLPKGIIAPRDHAAVRPQRQAVPVARGDGEDIAQRRRHIGLALQIAPPRNHMAVGGQGERMPATGRNSDEVGRRRRNIGLAIVVGTPSRDRTIVHQCDRVRNSRRHCHHASQRRRHVGLTACRHAPGTHSSAGGEKCRPPGDHPRGIADHQPAAINRVRFQAGHRVGNRRDVASVGHGCWSRQLSEGEIGAPLKPRDCARAIGRGHAAENRIGGANAARRFRQGEQDGCGIGQSERVLAARGNAEAGARCRRQRRLAQIIPAPEKNRPVLPQGETVIGAGRDGYRVGQGRRHVVFAVAVRAAPGRHRAVVQQREVVISGGGNRRDVAHVCRRRLAAPAGQGAVEFQRQAV